MSGTIRLLGDSIYSVNANIVSNTTVFSTSSTERMRIDSSGNIGIGTSTIVAGNVMAVYGGNVFVAGNIRLGNTATSIGGIAFPDGTFQNTAPTSGGGGGGGGWTYLSKVTASSASTADIDTTFSSTYDNYVIVASSIYCTDPVSINVLLKVAGTYQTSSYRWAYFYDFRNLGYVGDGNGSATLIPLCPAQAGGSSSTSNFVIYVWNAPLTTQNKLITWTGNHTADIITVSGAGAWVNGSSALTGVRFQPTSGTFTGTFRLYGIQNS